MRRLIIAGLVLLFMGSINAQQLQPVQLVQPDKTRGKAVMAALSERKSTREFNSRALLDQDLSDLLWAAWGVNREDGRRTAPSALNKQDVDVYVIMQHGAYIYDGKSHSLQPVSAGDHRIAVAGQQAFAAEAPVALVLVSDLDRFGGTVTEHTKLMAAVNIGVILQNINIFCAATGLVTVPRAFMDTEALREALHLKDSQLLLMNNPVGYPR
ncbi:MAG: SagB/ThcOx family dehydrogenase [Tannerellaceae bacterium]|nr:SagB/ThcOx family dehydrogenase [Tannerellaceae bacterium]